MFLTNLFIRKGQKKDTEIIESLKNKSAMVCKFLLKSILNNESEKELQMQSSLKSNDKIEKDESHDSTLASEYVVAIAKNLFNGEPNGKRKKLNSKIIGQITSSDNMNEQAKETINEIYKEQISKYKKANIKM